MRYYEISNFEPGTDDHHVVEVSKELTLLYVVYPGRVDIQDVKALQQLIYLNKYIKGHIIITMEGCWGCAADIMFRVVAVVRRGKCGQSVVEGEGRVDILFSTLVSKVGEVVSAGTGGDDLCQRDQVGTSAVKRESLMVEATTVGTLKMTLMIWLKLRTMKTVARRLEMNLRC